MATSFLFLFTSLPYFLILPNPFTIAIFIIPRETQFSWTENKYKQYGNAACPPENEGG